MLARSIGFLSLWSKEDQEVSVVATDELIIQMFTSHVIASHSLLCLFYIQTLFNVHFGPVGVMGLNMFDCFQCFLTQRNIRALQPNILQVTFLPSFTFYFPLSVLYWNISSIDVFESTQKKYTFICLALGCFCCSPYIMVLSHFAFKNSHKHCESTLPIVRLWTITRIRPKVVAYRLNHKVA